MYQDYFEEKKNRLSKGPILYLPGNRGWFQLFSDTIKMKVGSTLYYVQNSTPKLIGYASKRLPPAAANYSITE